MYQAELVLMYMVFFLPNFSLEVLNPLVLLYGFLLYCCHVSVTLSNRKLIGKANVKKFISDLCDTLSFLFSVGFVIFCEKVVRRHP